MPGPEAFLGPVRHRVFKNMAAAPLRRSRRIRQGLGPKGSLPDLADLRGKLIKGASMPIESKSKVHIANAVIGFVTLACGLVFGKPSETAPFTVIVEILDKRGLQPGKTVTVNAVGDQRKLARPTLGYGSGYLPSLKGNQ